MASSSTHSFIPSLQVNRDFNYPPTENSSPITSASQESQKATARESRCAILLAWLLSSGCCDASGRLLETRHHWPELKQEQIEALNAFLEKKVRINSEVELSLTEFRTNFEKLVSDKQKDLFLGNLTLAGSTVRCYTLSRDYLLTCLQTMGLPEPEKFLELLDLDELTTPGLDIDLRYHITFIGKRPPSTVPVLSQLGEQIAAALPAHASISKNRANKVTHIPKEQKTFIMRSFGPFELALIDRIGRSFQFPMDNMQIQWTKTGPRLDSTHVRGLSPLQAVLDSALGVIRIYDPKALDDYAWPKLMALLARGYTPVGEDGEGLLLARTAQVGGRHIDRLKHALANHCPDPNKALATVFQACLSMERHGLPEAGNPAGEWRYLCNEIKASGDCAPLLAAFEQLMAEGDLSFAQAAALLELLAWSNLNAPEGIVSRSRYFGKPALRIDLGNGTSLQLPADIQRCKKLLSKQLQLSDKTRQGIAALMHAMGPAQPYISPNSSPLELEPQLVLDLSELMLPISPDLALDLHCFANSLAEQAILPPRALLDHLLSGRSWDRWKRLMASWLDLPPQFNERVVIETAVCSPAPTLQHWAVQKIRETKASEQEDSLGFLYHRSPEKLIHLLRNQAIRKTLGKQRVCDYLVQLSKSHDHRTQLALSSLWQELPRRLVWAVLERLQADESQGAIRLLESFDWGHDVYCERLLENLHWLLATQEVIVPNALIEQFCERTFVDPELALVAMRRQRKHLALLLPLLNHVDNPSTHRALTIALARYHDRYYPDSSYPQPLRQAWKRHFPREQDRRAHRRLVELIANCQSSDSAQLRALLQHLLKVAPKELSLWRDLLKRVQDSADKQIKREFLRHLLRTVTPEDLPQPYPQLFAESIFALVDGCHPLPKLVFKQFLQGNGLLHRSFQPETVQEQRQQLHRKLLRLLGKRLFQATYNSHHLAGVLSQFSWGYRFELVSSCPSSAVEANRELLHVIYAQLFPSLAVTLEHLPPPLSDERRTALLESCQQMPAPQRGYVYHVLQQDAFHKGLWLELAASTLRRPASVLGQIEIGYAQKLLDQLVKDLQQDPSLANILLPAVFGLIQGYELVDSDSWESFEKLLTEPYIEAMVKQAPLRDRDFVLKLIHSLMPVDSIAAERLLDAVNGWKVYTPAQRTKLLKKAPTDNIGLIATLSKSLFTNEDVCRYTLGNTNYSYREWSKIAEKVPMPYCSLLLYCVADRQLRERPKSRKAKQFHKLLEQLRDTGDKGLMCRSIHEAAAGLDGKLPPGDNIVYTLHLMEVFDWDRPQEFSVLQSLTLKNKVEALAADILPLSYRHLAKHGLDSSFDPERWLALIQLSKTFPEDLLDDFLQGKGPCTALFKDGAHADFWLALLKESIYAISLSPEPHRSQRAKLHKGLLDTSAENILSSQDEFTIATELITHYALTASTSLHSIAVSTFLTLPLCTTLSPKVLFALRVLANELAKKGPETSETYEQLCEGLHALMKDPRYQVKELFFLLPSMIHIQQDKRAKLLGESLNRCVAGLLKDSLVSKTPEKTMRDAAEVALENLIDGFSMSCRHQAFQVWKQLVPEGKHGIHLLGKRLETHFHLFMIDSALTLGAGNELLCLVKDYFTYLDQRSKHSKSCKDCQGSRPDRSYIYPLYLAFRYLSTQITDADTKRLLIKQELRFLKWHKLTDGWEGDPGFAIDSVNRLLTQGLGDTMIPWAAQISEHLLSKLKASQSKDQQEELRQCFRRLVCFHLAYVKNTQALYALKPVLHHLVQNGYYPKGNRARSVQISLLGLQVVFGDYDHYNSMSYADKIQAVQEAIDLCWAYDESFSLDCALRAAGFGWAYLALQIEYEKSASRQREARVKMREFIAKSCQQLLDFKSRSCLQDPVARCAHMAVIQSELVAVAKPSKVPADKRAIAKLLCQILNITINLGKLDRADSPIAEQTRLHSLDCAKITLDSLRCLKDYTDVKDLSRFENTIDTLYRVCESDIYLMKHGVKLENGFIKLQNRQDMLSLMQLQTDQYLRDSMPMSELSFDLDAYCDQAASSASSSSSSNGK